MLTRVVENPRTEPEKIRAALETTAVGWNEGSLEKYLSVCDGRRRDCSAFWRPDSGESVTLAGRPTAVGLAFLATTGTGQNARRQIFLMPTSGGEARAITKAPSGVQQFSWRPNGQEIAFSTTDAPEKKTGEERHNDSFEVGSNDYLATSAPGLSHIWIAPASAN